MTVDGFELELPRSDAAAALARREVERRFGAVVADETLEDAKVVVSELVANALVHGDGAVTLRGGLQDARLRLEVSEEGSGPAPAVREDDEDDEDDSGWGLRVVDALSLRWGAYEGTTHVWAELAVRPRSD
ncbi:MAG TPA: ATP-binding protein [Solirubrobacteraceae bacterium]